MHRRLFSVMMLLCLLFGLSTVVSAKNSPFPISAGSSLTGLEKTIYDRLGAQILKISTGECVEPTVSFTLKELGLDGAWTAQDLGVSSLFQGDSFSQAAVDAVYDKLDFDSGLVVDALLADYPFDLFWFDKTMGFSIFSPACTSDGNTIWFAEGETLDIRFAVCQEYAKMVDVTHYNPYLLDPAALEAYGVENARAEALRIVQANANKSNYEKLVAYREAICDAVSYHHTAASNPNYPYGNPWQPIYAFDGDSDTNVVCEGYAKAFKYLCDLSDFVGDVRCYLVDGWTDSGTGQGNHMWNVLAMPNGKTYLVDLTNCDEHTLGHPDWMFLAGNDNDGNVDADYVIIVPEHPIENGYISLGGQISYDYKDTMYELWNESILKIADEDYVPGEDEPEEPVHTHTVMVQSAVLPTCTASGLTEGSYCLTCNEVLTAQKTVPALGHNEVVDSAVLPTCTETGLTEGKHCSVCDEVLSAQKTVPALGHNEVVDSAVPPSCTETGLTEGSHCSVCSEVLSAQETVPVVNHSFSVPAFCWADDLGACLVSVSCANCSHTIHSDCQVTSTVAADGKAITVTALGTVDGQQVTDTLVIQTENHQLRLPQLPDNEIGTSVQVLIVSYESCGKLSAFRMAQFTDGMVDFSDITGDRLLIFFPTTNSWAPILPALTIK